MRELSVHECSNLGGGRPELHAAMAAVGVGAASVSYMLGGAMLGYLDPWGGIVSMTTGGAASLLVDYYYYQNPGFFAFLFSYDIGERAFYAATIGTVAGLGGSVAYVDPLHGATNACMRHCSQLYEY